MSRSTPPSGNCRWRASWPSDGRRCRPSMPGCNLSMRAASRPSSRGSLGGVPVWRSWPIPRRGRRPCGSLHRRRRASWRASHWSMPPRSDRRGGRCSRASAELNGRCAGVCRSASAISALVSLSNCGHGGRGGMRVGGARWSRAAQVLPGGACLALTDRGSREAAKSVKSATCSSLYSVYVFS